MISLVICGCSIQPRIISVIAWRDRNTWKAELYFDALSFPAKPFSDKKTRQIESLRAISKNLYDPTLELNIQHFLEKIEAMNYFVSDFSKLFMRFSESFDCWWRFLQICKHNSQTFFQHFSDV